MDSYQLEELHTMATTNATDETKKEIEKAGQTGTVPLDSGEKAAAAAPTPAPAESSVDAITESASRLEIEPKTDADAAPALPSKGQYFPVFNWPLKLAFS